MKRTTLRHPGPFLKDARITPVRGLWTRQSPGAPRPSVFPLAGTLGPPRCWPHPWDMLPPSIHIMLDPAQDGAVDILL